MKNVALGKLITRVLVSAIVSGLIVSYSSQNNTTILAQTPSAEQPAEPTSTQSNNSDLHNWWINIALAILALEGFVYLLIHFRVQLPMQKKFEQIFDNIEQDLKNFRESFNNSLNELLTELKSLKTSVPQQLQEQQGLIPSQNPPSLGDLGDNDNSSSNELSQQIEQVKTEFNQQIEKVQKDIVKQITIAINSQTATIQQLPEKVKNNLIQDSQFIEQIANQLQLRPELPKQDSVGTFSPPSQSVASDPPTLIQVEPNYPSLPPLTLTQEEENIINNYNHQVDLSQWSTEVSVTEESELDSRAGKDPIIMFKQESPGSYWVITVPQGKYLVPKPKNKFNTQQMASVQELFECRSYERGIDPRNFKLVKSGKVSSAGDSWKLEEKGILDFNASG